MSVTSLCFLVFTALLWLSVRILKANVARQWLLLVASYLFYATFGLGFLGLLVASSVANYFLGQRLKRRTTPSFLWACVAINCLFLGVFKYLPQAWAGVSTGFFAKIMLPVGISFWTFQALSYLFDIYRGEELDPSLPEFLLYMAFWPTVLSGPIARLGEMLPQFRAIPNAGWKQVAMGVRRVITGLFLKVGLAQLMASGIRPGEGVDFAFDGMTQQWGGLDVWFLALGYGLQLYFDFAGFSHIVIGAAQLFGISLPENFDDPYLSRTPSEFWTRWHMSLSFWIRDYLFLPLAMLRSAPAWRYASLVLSMTVFGLWHGATWTYALWGAYNGCVLVIHRLLQAARHRIPGNLPAEGVLSWALTSMGILLGWILFRANTLPQAFTMLRSVVSPAGYFHLALLPNYYLLTLATAAAYLGLAVIRRNAQRWRILPAVTVLSPLYYAAAIVLIIIFSGHKSVFVYFQF
jgi:alginate O-acetyltransferase complex protein AlgI